MPLIKKKVRQPGKINYSINSQNFKCLLIASKGRSNACIQRRINLSDGQIYYRLKQHGISRRDIRDGYGEFARIVDESSDQFLESYLIEVLERNL